MNQADNESLQIRLEQVRLLYRPTIIVAIAYVVGGIFLSFVQFKIIDHTALLVWLSCMGLVVTGRVLSYLAFQRKNPNTHDIKLWENIFLIGAIAAGLTWGSAGILLFPHGAPEYQLLTLI